MEYRRELYKNGGFKAGDRARAQRSAALSKARMESRMNMLTLRRNMTEVTTQTTEKKTNKLVEMLAQWKAEKKKAMMEMKKKQKPVFKVGILQRKATGSPLLKMSTTYAEKNFLNPCQLNKVNKAAKNLQNGMITRAKAKALLVENQENIKTISSFSKIVNDKRKQIKNHTFTVPKSVSDLAKQMKVTIPQSPEVLKHGRSFRVKINNEIKMAEDIESTRNQNMVEEIENAFQNIKNTNDKGKTPSVGQNQNIVDVKVNISPVEDRKTDSHDFVPIHYSPYVNKSRGSMCKSPRKSKINLTIDVDKLIEKEENEFKCRIFSFRKYIECQTKRLLESCTKWKILAETEPNIPNDVEEEILSLCGKTVLLTSDKFSQFRDLIDKCENKDPMVKVEDLQGYQDWVSLEVESLDQAIMKLEERKNNNWVKINEEPANCEGKKKTKLPPAKKPVKHQVRSNIREHILAARKLKQNTNDISSFNKLDTWIKGKTPVKTPRKESPLLKEVLNSETKKLNGSLLRSRRSISNSIDAKKRISGMEIVAATQLAKYLTPGRKSTISCSAEQTSFVETTTPLKSILKQTPGSLNTSKHSVQFSIRQSTGCSKDVGLNEKYFNPVMDEDDCCDISAKIGNFSLASPKTARKKHMVSTPIRRSARLALK